MFKGKKQQQSKFQVNQIFKRKKNKNKNARRKHGNFKIIYVGKPFQI